MSEDRRSANCAMCKYDQLLSEQRIEHKLTLFGVVFARAAGCANHSTRG
jgi:hypothetical protein